MVEEEAEAACIQLRGRLSGWTTCKSLCADIAYHRRGDKCGGLHLQTYLYRGDLTLLSYTIYGLYGGSMRRGQTEGGL